VLHNVELQNAEFQNIKLQNAELQNAELQNAELQNVESYRTSNLTCAGSSGIVHSVFLIDVYLDLENPGGSGFWVGDSRRVVGGKKGVSLRASGSRGGRILTQKEGSK
jgi:uncharacterized protein YjbI with pentapeptide repeats